LLRNFNCYRGWFDFAELTLKYFNLKRALVTTFRAFAATDTFRPVRCLARINAHAANIGTALAIAAFIRIIIQFYE